MVGELGRGRVGACPDRVAGSADAGATEDDVVAVGPQGRRGQTEQGGAAADDVVLTQPAEDHVVATTPLDVVVAVGKHVLDGRGDG